MKNSSYPRPDEIKKVIVGYERINALRTQLEEKSATLRRATTLARERVVPFLRVTNDGSKALSHFVSLYRKSRDKDYYVSEAISAYETADADYDQVSQQIDTAESDLRTNALHICAEAEGIQRAEYEELIKKIEAALRPFCEGDEFTAHQIAVSTPAALTKHSERERCYTTLYGGNLIPPLQAVLQFATR